MATFIILRHPVTTLVTVFPNPEKQMFFIFNFKGTFSE